MKRNIVIFLGLILVLFLASACQNRSIIEPSSKSSDQELNEEPTKTVLPAETETEESFPEPAESETWSLVQTFTGTGMVNTEEFTIKNDRWRVRISGTSQDPQQSSFTAFLRLRGDDPEALDDHGQISGQGVEPVVRNFFATDTYFIHMHAEHLDWKIEIEEQER